MKIYDIETIFLILYHKKIISLLKIIKMDNVKEVNKIRVGISQGDINGISYEIIIKTLFDNGISDICTPIVYGSQKIAAYFSL